MISEGAGPPPAAPERPANRVDPLVARLIESTNLEIRRFFRFAAKPRQSQFLYKYRVVDPESPRAIGRLRSIIVDSRIYLSSPADFNDPFDHAVKVIAEATDAEREAHHRRLIDKEAGPQSPERYSAILQTMLARPPAVYAAEMGSIVMQHAAANGVYSFAGCPRNLQMWTYYGDEHRGICLQFDIARDPRNLIHVNEVDYEDTYPVFNCFQDTEPQIKAIILRKHPGWIREAELRLILPGGANTVLAFKPEALTAVVLGCRSTDANRAVVLSLLRERAARGHKMVVPSGEARCEIRGGTSTGPRSGLGRFAGMARPGLSP